MIKPERLKKGDKIAIVSLSWGGLGDAEFIHKYDIAKEKDKKYKRLLLDEMKWINKNQDKILKNARTLYYFKKNEVKNRNVKNERLYNAILPFELIEFHLRYFLNKKWFIH